MYGEGMNDEWNNDILTRTTMRTDGRTRRRVRLHWRGVVVNTRHFLGRGMLGVYSSLSLQVRRY